MHSESIVVRLSQDVLIGLQRLNTIIVTYCCLSEARALLNEGLVAVSPTIK